jgi:hypothetical protein
MLEAGQLKSASRIQMHPFDSPEIFLGGLIELMAAWSSRERGGSSPSGSTGGSSTCVARSQFTSLPVCG